MLQKLDKYILAEFLLPLIAGAGIITGVWLGIDKFKEVFSLLAKSGASFDKGLIILGLEIPQILATTLPIAILLAAFLTFQKLSGQSELLAIRAAGVSFGRVMRPVVFLGALGMLFSFVLSEFVVPITNPFAKKVYSYSLYKSPVPQQSRDYSYYEKNSDGEIRRIFYVKHIKDDVLKDMVVLDFSEDRTAQIYTARTGHWSPERGGWLLEDGSNHYIQRASAKQDEQARDLVMHFDTTLIPSGANPKKILEKISNLRDLNILGLLEFIDLHGDDQYYTPDINRAKTNFHNKFAYPFSCILLAVIGACLGIIGRRRVINWGYIALGLVVFVFYMSQSVFDSFGDSGRIAPMISVWIPNVILFGVGYLCVWYRTRT